MNWDDWKTLIIMTLIPTVAVMCFYAIVRFLVWIGIL